MLLSVKKRTFHVCITSYTFLQGSHIAINRARGFYREISDRDLFSTDQARRARFVHKDQGPIFLCKDQASEVNKKFLYGIDRHLYLKQTRNA
jgi:hypothetical protein